MFEIGDVYLMDLGKDRGNEEAGVMPCVVVSGELHNTVNRTVIAIPITKSLSKAYWHEHTVIDVSFVYGECISVEKRVAMCEHIREVDKKFVKGSVLGFVDDEDLLAIKENLQLNVIPIK